MKSCTQAWCMYSTSKETILNILPHRFWNVKYTRNEHKCFDLQGIIIVNLRYLHMKCSKSFENQFEYSSLHTPTWCADPMHWSFYYSFVGCQILVICMLGRTFLHTTFHYTIGLFDACLRQKIFSYTVKNNKCNLAITFFF